MSVEINKSLFGRIGVALGRGVLSDKAVLDTAVGGDGNGSNTRSNRVPSLFDVVPKSVLIAFGTVVTLLFSYNALAHQPSYSKGEFVSPETAWPIQEIDLSIVLYHRVTCDSPALWLSFDASEPMPIFFQLGVPQIDRLAGYRPSIALLAPGLPPIDEDVPFEVPEGLGGMVLSTGDLTEGESFFEPFTQTSSWILAETTENLPKAGRGYIVAWEPNRQTGKLWVAVGKREDFSNIDFSASLTWLEQTQTFHEVGGYAPEEPVVEEICPEPVVEEKTAVQPDDGTLADADKNSTQDAESANETNDCLDCNDEQSASELNDKNELNAVPSGQSGCAVGPVNSGLGSFGVLFLTLMTMACLRKKQLISAGVDLI